MLVSLCAANPAFRLTDWEAPGGKRLPLVLSEYRRIAGSPIQSTYDLLQELYDDVPETLIEGIRVTGSGSRTIAKILGLYFENEFKAIARMIGAFYPHVKTVFEIGGESSKYIRLENGGIVDYDRSGECAAGTGSFLDQQALRMQYSVEEVGGLVCGACHAARIAGRCSVFAKSDMIHAQQKGYSPAEILRGLCDAVARNFKSSIVKGRKVEAPGGAHRRGFAEQGRYGRAAGGLRAGAKATCSSPSITPGAAPSAPPCWRPRRRASAACCEIHRLDQHEAEARVQDTEPLSMDNVVLLRDRVPKYVPPDGDVPIPAYLGLDIGSVSTNVVVIDEHGAVIHDVYLRTAGRPVEAVQQGLTEVEQLWGSAAGDPRRGHHRLRPRADCRVRRGGRGERRDHRPQDRRLAHQPHAHRRAGGHHLRDRRAGLQVHLHRKRRGGGFRHERGLRRGHRARSSKSRRKSWASASRASSPSWRSRLPSPTRLGERCTVFMERDVTGWLHKGETVPNLVAGLAFSIALNYLNRVVRGRHIGNVIYFQGGTAYNDAVAAAFASVLGKKITVPPYNGVMGAIGMALIARQWHAGHRRPVALPRLEPATTCSSPPAISSARPARTSATSRNSTSRARRATGATSARTSSASPRPRAASR